jgi:hypothetical protein
VLGPQVVGREPVAPGEPRCGAPAGSCRLLGQRGEVEPDRPALGTREHLAQVGFVEFDPRARQQRARFVVGHRQVGDADLAQFAVRTQARQGQRRIVAGGERELRGAWEVLGERGDDVEAVGVLYQFDVVEAQCDGFLHCSHRAGEARRHRRRQAHTARPGRPQPVDIDRLDAVERRRRVSEQTLGIVVALVEGHPRDARRRTRSPLREHRRLAVARWRDDRDDPVVRGRHALEERDARDERGAHVGRRELGREEVVDRPLPCLVLASDLGQ